MIEDQVMITWLGGEKKLEPLKWLVRRLPHGQGEIIGDFCTLSGEYDDLITNVPLLGGVVSFEDASE